MTTTIEQFLMHINKRLNVLELEVQKLQNQRRQLHEARVIPIRSARSVSREDLSKAA